LGLRCSLVFGVGANEPGSLPGALSHFQFGLTSAPTDFVQIIRKGCLRRCHRHRSQGFACPADSSSSSFPTPCLLLEPADLAIDAVEHVLDLAAPPDVEHRRPHGGHFATHFGKLAPAGPSERRGLLGLHQSSPRSAAAFAETPETGSAFLATLVDSGRQRPRSSASPAAKPRLRRQSRSASQATVYMAAADRKRLAQEGSRLLSARFGRTEQLAHQEQSGPLPKKR
jgi:hypothetical protein